MKPEQLLYTKTHEWVGVEPDASGAKIATVGISAFALKALTDLVFMELPPAGSKVRSGEAFGEVESVKAVSDLISPVDGEIIDVNDAIVDNLDTMAEDPYGAGWLIKVKLADEAALANLLDYSAYQKQCEQEH